MSGMLHTSPNTVRGGKYMVDLMAAWQLLQSCGQWTHTGLPQTPRDDGDAWGHQRLHGDHVGYARVVCIVGGAHHERA